MVQNIINIGTKEDRILNIVKAVHSLKNKSEAVAFIVNKYEENFLEPELRPEYIEKLEKIRKEKGIRFKNIEELRSLIED